MAVGPDDEHASAIVEATIAVARTRFGTRLRSVYVIGSLAHGGFSPLVSDVDMALLLADPLRRGRDRLQIMTLRSELTGSGLPLAARLSLFWGTVASLNRGRGGRLPAADRLDLMAHGVLRFGEPVAARLHQTNLDVLVVEAARFTLDVLGTGEKAHELHSPALLASHGPRAVTKAVLFPVRFLYTLATGSVGANDDAGAHYLATGPTAQAAELVSRALQWRTSWTAADESDAAPLIAAALAPLYREFAAAYVARLQAISQDRLASRLAAFVATL